MKLPQTKKLHTDHETIIETKKEWRKLFANHCERRAQYPKYKNNSNTQPEIKMGRVSKQTLSKTYW